MNRLFSNMLQLPLFQGIGQEDFTHILGRVKFHFTKHPAGEEIAQQGTICKELLFLLKGKLAISTTAPNRSYTFIEYAHDNHLFEPSSLFGLNTTYTATYTAETDISLLRINKDQLVKELFRYEIFRFNFNNYICNKVQVLKERLWQNIPSDTSRKIALFILSRSEKIEGEKRIQIKMEDLAVQLDDTRLNVSKALNELQEKNLLQLSRKDIYIPDGEALLNYTSGMS